MRRLAFLALVALLVLPSALGAQSKDEQAIRAVLDRALRTLNSVDEKVIQQISADFARGAGPFFPPFGGPLASASEAERYLVELARPARARSFAPTSPMPMRLDKNTAWTAFTWRAEATLKDGTRRSFEGRATVSFVREGKNWKVAHWHSSLAAVPPATAADLQAEAQGVLQVERNAWETRKNKQPAAWGDYFAENASVFHEGQAYRLSGRAEILRELEAWLSRATLRSYQILDPQVQVRGDTALLTYYFTESGVDAGKDFTTAGKVTAVFVKQEGNWRLLHEHRSVNR